MSRSVDVVVVGATTLVGETLLALLDERDFPVGNIFLADQRHAAGTRLAFKGRYLLVEDVASCDFSRAKLAFFVASADISAQHAPRAAAQGCVVIDRTPQFRLEADVPLVVPEVNPEAIAGYGQRRILANPSCATIELALALKPLHDAVGVERVNVCTLQAVSGAGRSGIEELAGQSAALLNMKDLETKTFPKQIAFNVLPQIGGWSDNGYTDEEMKLVEELRIVLAEERLLVNATAVRVPVFYGHCAAVHVETRAKLTAREARHLLAHAPGVELLDERRAGAYPTPVTDAAAEDPVYIGRVREDISHPRGLDFWVVTDNIRKGAALNGIQIAEILVKDYVN